VYEENVQYVNELRERITRTAKPFISEILTIAWREPGYLLEVCRANNGAHVGIYCGSKKLGEVQRFGNIDFSYTRSHQSYITFQLTFRDGNDM
jgi:hypothetical protein